MKNRILGSLTLRIKTSFACPLLSSVGCSMNLASVRRISKLCDRRLEAKVSEVTLSITSERSTPRH